MSKVEVRSNIRGELAKIRRGVVYGDVTTVVDELVQNAKRAHATEVRYVTLDDGFAIMDDGKGCDDPQSLFEQHYSGWGDCDEAFGEGFFSVFAVADNVEARSRDWKASFDVDAMMESGDLEIPVSKARKVKGFRCCLRGGRAYDDERAMRSRFEHIAKLDQSMRFSVNDRRAGGKRNVKGELGEWGMEFHNEIYDAYLRPATGSYHSPEIAYDDRPVDGESYFAEYAKGIVMVKKGGATPKAPDRKTFVWDSKRTALKESLRDDIRDMFVRFLSKASADEIDGYGEAIERCVPVSVYAYRIPLVDCVTSGVEADESAEHDVAAAIAASRRASSDGAGQPFNDTDNTIGGKKRGKHERKAGTLAEYVSRMKESGAILAYGSSSSEDDRRLAQTMSYEGVTVLWAPNAMYAKAFEELGIQRIGSIDGGRKDYSFDCRGASCRAERIAGARLDRFLESAGVEAKLLFADISEVVTVSGETVMRRGIEGCCDRKERVIYIDRRHFDVSGYSLTDDGRSEDDWRCMMLLQDVVCHELAHLVFGTDDNTLEHFQKTAELTREYARLV